MPKSLKRSARCLGKRKFECFNLLQMDVSVAAFQPTCAIHPLLLHNPVKHKCFTCLLISPDPLAALWRTSSAELSAGGALHLLQ